MKEKEYWRPRIKMDSTDERDAVIKTYLSSFSRGEGQFVCDCIKAFVHRMATHDVRANTAEVVEQLMSGEKPSEGVR